MPGGNPVHGIGIVRYPDAVSAQLVTKSYRPRAGDRRRRPQSLQALGELLGPAHQRLPEPLAPIGVERREDLAAIAVEDGEPLPGPAGLADSQRQGIEGADPDRPQAGGGAQPACGRDADPQPGEGAGPEADREQADSLPAPGRAGAALDLLEQRGRVPGPPLGGEPQLRLVQDLAVAPGAGGGVGGRGVEADEDQRGTASSP